MKFQIKDIVQYTSFGSEYQIVKLYKDKPFLDLKLVNIGGACSDYEVGHIFKRATINEHLKVIRKSPLRSHPLTNIFKD